MGWANNEFEDASFGDERLRRRAIELCERLAAHPTESVLVACHGRSEVEAAYRFFSNERVTAAPVLAPHQAASVRRIAEHKLVLCVQDTTELNFTGKQTTGLGPLNLLATNGLHLHVTLAVTPQRQALGVVAHEFIVRDPASFGRERKSEPRYRSRPISEKESGRWLRSFAALHHIAGKVPGTRLVCLCDCEADIYDLLVQADHQTGGQPRVEYVIRSQYDRLVADAGPLRAVLEHRPVLGDVEFRVAATPTRQERLVHQTMRAAQVCLLAPEGKEHLAHWVTTNAILLVEPHPPAGEEPLEWILLTSLPVTSGAEAAEKVQWYLCRWEVEVYFRIYKSGCQVERLQLESYQHLEPALALYMIIAWRIQHITMLGRSCPDLPCSVLFDETEWQTAFVMAHHQRPPTTPPRLAEIITAIASFGGYLARKSDPPPGPKAIWIGLQRLRDFVLTRITLEEVNRICEER